MSHSCGHANHTTCSPEIKNAEPTVTTPNLNSTAPGMDATSPSLFLSGRLNGNTSHRLISSSALALQRTAGNQAMVRHLQRKQGGTSMPPGGSPLAQRIDHQAGKGERLPSSIQRAFEPEFGSWLSNVNIHTDSQADALARDVDSIAFTTGSDIFFRSGRLNTSTDEGLFLLGHELSHVEQQAQGQVSGLQAFGDVQISEPHDRFEQQADARANSVVAGIKSGEKSNSIPDRIESTPAIQRKPMSTAQSGSPLVVQRLTELSKMTQAIWKTESNVRGRKRSVALRAIDTAIENWATAMQLPGQIDQLITRLQDLLKAIDDYKTAKGQGYAQSNRRNYVNTLRKNVVLELATQAQRKQRQDSEIELATQRSLVYKSMEPEMARYAERELPDNECGLRQMTDFEPGGVTDAMVRTRSDVQGLDADAVEIIEAVNAKNVSDLRAKAKAADYGIVSGGVSHQDLQTYMDSNTNEITGETITPELRNVLTPNNALDKMEEESVDMGGVTWQVEYNASDVNFAMKLAAVKKAVEKIIARGFEVPAMHLHFPKYGRKIKFSSATLCTVSHATERAAFIAPNFLHISSDALNIPLTTPATGVKNADEHLNRGYKFSSTALDPSGVATMIHEMGHALHYQNNPSKFHNLHKTYFKGAGLFKKVNEQVSEYGTRPREFVAEVFLGLVFGRIYSDEIMTMYSAFGGALPSDLAHFSETKL